MNTTQSPWRDAKSRINGWLTSIYPDIRYLFELDPRSLALFRIVFGALCLADLWLRLPHLQMMYASSGWLPSHRVLWYASTTGQDNPHGWSLLYLFNTPPMITAFFIGAMFCAFCFMIGYRTRMFQILTGLCMISVHTRNTVLHNGGDIVHNLWWMWTIWLPLGKRWSIDVLRESWRAPDPDDAALNRVRTRDVSPYITLVTLGLLVNLSLCYYLNGVHKNSPDWISGDAVPYVFEQDRILRWFGAIARETLPLWLMRVLTWVTLVFESSAPLFLLIPMVTRRLHLGVLAFGVIGCLHMLSSAPFTMSLIVGVSAITAWFICSKSSRLVGLAHAQFNLIASASLFLLAFPLWLASVTGVTYALITEIVFRFKAETRQLWMRRISLAVLAGFHLNATLTMQLGFFSYWMLSIYLVLIHPRDWELIARLFKPRAPALTLYYDSDCGVCHAFARICARLDLYRLITWVGRSEPEIIPGGLELSAFNKTREETLIATLTHDHSTLWLHHKAIAQTLRRLPFLAPIGWLLILTGPVGRAAYQAFAQRRHHVSAWLGYGACGLPRPDVTATRHTETPKLEESGLKRLRHRLLTGGRELGVLVCFVASILICLNTNPHFRKRHAPKSSSLRALSGSIDGTLKENFPSIRHMYRRPWRPAYLSWARSFAVYGGFHQGWGLFTTVPKTDGWMVFEVKLRDGRVLDMRTGEAPSYEVANYLNRSWGFYEGRWGLKLLRKSDRHKLFTDWVKRPVQRMRLNPKDIVDELNIYWVADQTQPPVASGYRPPLFKEKKSVLAWSRAAGLHYKKR